MLSTEKVTAKAMKMFFKMEDPDLSDEEEDEKPEVEHVNKKQKPADPIVYEIKLSADDGMKIGIAAMEFYFMTGDRWEWGCDSLPASKKYAADVFEKAKELRYTYGDAFDVDSIVNAFFHKAHEPGF